jgi:hypothetical protein
MVITHKTTGTFHYVNFESPNISRNGTHHFENWEKYRRNCRKKMLIYGSNGKEPKSTFGKIVISYLAYKKS